MMSSSRSWQWWWDDNAILPTHPNNQPPKWYTHITPSYCCLFHLMIIPCPHTYCSRRHVLHTTMYAHPWIFCQTQISHIASLGLIRPDGWCFWYEPGWNEQGVGNENWTGDGIASGCWSVCTRGGIRWLIWRSPHTNGIPNSHSAPTSLSTSTSPSSSTPNTQDDTFSTLKRMHLWICC